MKRGCSLSWWLVDNLTGEPVTCYATRRLLREAIRLYGCGHEARLVAL